MLSFIPGGLVLGSGLGLVAVLGAAQRKAKVRAYEGIVGLFMNQRKSPCLFHILKKKHVHTLYPFSTAVFQNRYIEPILFDANSG
ncbi:hypothetical protein B0T13DRAFT_463118 [Neurospora crassa]|nr:hypothetical protein B0T13DRAFT_463118 [Neurospora crassa]